MTRNYTLLHYSNSRLVEARRATWELEDKSPGGLKVLLSSPRWERRLLRLLELSGVGRIVEDEAGEERGATRPDGWEAEERGRGGSLTLAGPQLHLFLSFSCTYLIKEGL
jgi:hypothetical protein